LEDLVRGTVASLRARLDAQSVDVGLDLEPGVVARADADKVRQLVMNLLENALDALAAVEGSRQIDVAVAGVNGHAALAIEDNGPGVPADALPRLFEPFFSLKPHGTGLGLAIAKRTVDAHGGRLAATPNQHGGLRIDVELPLAGAAHDACAGAGRALPRPPPAARSMSADQVIDGLLMLLPAAAQACVAWQDRGRTGRLPHPGVLLGLSWALAALPQDVDLGPARIAA